MKQTRHCDVYGTIDDVEPTAVVVFRGVGLDDLERLLSSVPIDRSLDIVYQKDLGDKALTRLHKSIKTALKPPTGRSSTPTPPPAPPNETTTGARPQDDGL